MSVLTYISFQSNIMNNEWSTKTVQNHSKSTKSDEQWSTKTVQNHSKSIKSNEQWSTKTIQSHSESSGSRGKFPKLLAEKSINTDMQGAIRILNDTLDDELANHISQNEPVSCSVWPFFAPVALTDSQIFLKNRAGGAFALINVLQHPT